MLAKRILTQGSWFLVCLLGLGACSTSPSISDVRYSQPQIFHAIESVCSMGIAEKQDKGRIVITNPFKVKAESRSKDEGEFRERGVAYIYVLGLDQPYKIEAEVVIERAYYDPTLPKKDREKYLQYSKDRTDERLAKLLLTSIREYLVSQQRNKNIIDDFRPF